MTHRHPHHLARHLALAYILLIIYASLHPFTGWRDSGQPWLAFLQQPWPRYWTRFDLTINILAYLPLGLVLGLSRLLPLPEKYEPQRFPRHILPILVVLGLTLLGASLSLCLEVIQNGLPSRVPSHLDLACNSLGTLLGAWYAVRHGQNFFNRLARFQHRLLKPTPGAERGLLVLGLWLLALLSPEILPLGLGDVRSFLGMTPIEYAPERFQKVVLALVTCQTVAVGLMVRALLAERVAQGPVLLLFFGMALGLRSLAQAIQFGPGSAFDWINPGVGLGWLLGLQCLALTLMWPNWVQAALAAVLLMMATVLANLAPENPYHAMALWPWQQGQWLNFNGLTRLIALLWPFLALPWLLSQAGVREAAHLPAESEAK